MWGPERILSLKGGDERFAEREDERKDAMTNHRDEDPTHKDEDRPTPTAAELAEAFGFPLAEPIEPRKIHRLRRAFPGSSSVLREVAEQLAADEGALRLRGFTTEGLKALAKDRDSAARAEVTLSVAQRAAYERRMTLDDRMMIALRKVQKSVVHSDDAELRERFRFLDEFLRVFSGGRPKAKTEGGGERDEHAPE